MAYRCLNLLMLIYITVFLSTASRAQDLKEFEKKITEFTLDNGLEFIVIEKHEAPVASFHTFANVGAVDEVKGITGVAHMFEHMAFKGTNTVGTRNIEKELQAIGKIDTVYENLRREKQKRHLADTLLIQKLEKQFEQAQRDAQEWVVSNETGEAIDRAGGVGLNASTSWDWTRYYYSLPSHKMELWFSLESDRFLNPVLRKFYTEKDIVMEERRMRTESSPFGRLLEEFFTIAYKAHPYGEPSIGHMSDLQSMTRAEAMTFFEKYYGANNLTVAIAGDVDPKEIKKLAQTYFGRLPKRLKPEPVETVEPEQLGERRVVIEDKAQPMIIIGYHKGSIHHPDDIAFNVLWDIIGRGRASRLYKNLVKETKIAIQTSSFAHFPGEKYPNLMLFWAVSAKGRTAEECEGGIYQEIERLKTESVSPQELAKAKTRARADLIRQLDSNTGLALQLAYYQAMTGDWRTLFHRLDRINAVTTDDIQRIAQQYLVKTNRTVAIIKTVVDKEVASMQ